MSIWGYIQRKVAKEYVMNREKDTGNGFLPVSDIEVDVVRPERSGFVLQGRGADRAEYRIEMRLGLPVDQQTQTVLGEILAQSELKVFRKAPASMRRPATLRKRKTAQS
jgi:hypothetical protein